MQCLLLIYENEKQWASMPKNESETLFGEYRAFTQSIAQSGHYKGGNPLQPTNTATNRTRAMREPCRAVCDSGGNRGAA